MPGWEQLGMQAASQGISAGMGLLLQGANDRRQLKQQEKLQQLQIRGDKDLTNYNFQKQMEMWRNTNYPAQMAMLKAAGLNPALIYENGGPGAQTSITQGNVAGASAPTGGAEIQSMMALGLQREMIQAQIELTKAQTQKTTAETGAVAPGIAKTTQETVNLKTQNAIAEIDKAFQEKSLENRLSLVNLGLSKLIEETKIIENDRQISDSTKKTQIAQIVANLKNTLADTLNKQKQTAKTDAEINQINKAIEVMQQQLDINAIDAEMAKDGFNPKAGGIMKIVHNILRMIAQSLGN